MANHVHIDLKDAGQWANVRRLNYLHEKKIDRVLYGHLPISADGKPLLTTVDQIDDVAGTVALLKAAVLEWSFPFPVDEAGLEQLDPEDMLAILREAVKGTKYTALLRLPIGETTEDAGEVPLPDLDFTNGPSSPSGAAGVFPAR